MIVTDAPAALPSSCIRCPGSTRKRYIDTDLHIEFHGAVYICDECVTEMGRLLGMLSADQAEDLFTDLSLRDSEVYELKRKVAGLEAAVRGLADAGFEPVPQRRDPGILSSDVAGQGDISTGAESLAPSGADNLGEGAGTAPQPGDDEQLAGVRSDDGGNGGNFRLSL